MLSFTKNRNRPQNRQVCLTTPLDVPFTGVQVCLTSPFCLTEIKQEFGPCMRIRLK